MENRFAVTNIHRVVFVSKDEYKNDTIAFNQCLSKNELIYHISGESTVFFNGKQLDVTPNCIRFLPACQVHEYTVTRKVRGDCIDIVFDTNIPVFDEAIIIQLKNSETIKNLFKKTFALWVAKDEGYYYGCVSLIYKIFAELDKKNYIPENQYLYIKPAVQYIENNFFKEDITSKTLTDCCTISYSYIKKLFVKRFGVPPKKYILQLKMNYASELLRSEMYSVSQVAENCGYNNVNFFSRQFKGYYGLSPTDFIKKYKSSK